MFYYEGLSCPVCGKPFVAEDDIVVCPKCGLPHHRECWKRVGHCYEVKKHDTAEQWTRERGTAQQAVHSTPDSGTASGDKQVCSRCGEHNPEFAEFCTRCGCSLNATDWHSAQPYSQPQRPPVNEYTPYGPANPPYSTTEKIGDHTAEELVTMVGNKGHYYLPRFRAISHGGSGGWNWPAFIFGPFWLFYRKQYGLGVLCFIIHTLANIASFIAYDPVMSAVDEAAALAAETALMNSPLFIPVALLAVLDMLMCVVLGLKGNEFYFRFCTKKITAAKKDTPDLSPAELASIGGVSVGIVLLFGALTYMTMQVIAILML